MNVPFGTKVLLKYVCDPVPIWGAHMHVPVEHGSEDCWNYEVWRRTPAEALEELEQMWLRGELERARYKR